jgi:hypothetical protein
MAKILQQMSDHKTPRGKDVALERFLKFQPLTFFRAVELDQQAKQLVEQMEDLFQALQYTDH